MPNGKRLSSGKDQHIMPREELISRLPREFPENTLRPISHHRTAKSLPDDDPYPSLVEPRRRGDKIEQRSWESTSAFLHPFDVGAVSQEVRAACRQTGHEYSGAASYTVSRTRPFARRRAKTFRPFLVLMRLRNP